MTSILYYSGYCQNCSKLINVLSKSKIKEELHFPSSSIDFEFEIKNENLFINRKSCGFSHGVRK